MKRFFNGFTTSVKSMSISKRLIIYILLILAAQMVLIGCFSYNWTSDYLKKLNIKEIRESNDTIMQQANFIRKKYEDISDNFLANPTIQELLLSNLSTTTMLAQNIKTIDRSLSDPNEGIYTLIASENGIVYQSYSGKYSRITFDQIKNSKVYKNSFESRGRNIWLPAMEDLLMKVETPYLYLCRTYMSVKVLYKPLGQLVIQIPFREIQEIFNESDLDTREYYAIIDENGKYIYHTQDTMLIGKQAENSLTASLSFGEEGYRIVQLGKEDFLLSYSSDKEDGWNIVHLLPMDIIRASAREASYAVLLIMLAAMLLSMPVLVFILRSFTGPIKSLKTAVEQFGNGNSAIRAKTDRMDEIGLLQISFNKMAEKINDQMVKIEEDNKQKRLMEINMLEYQINPHFLYNSLDFINWMAQKSGNEDISEMVIALARFFRVGLSKGKEFYRIKDELDHIQQYLLVNKLRFKDCFQFEIQGDPAVMNYYTIKIILQPAVENAIKHGLNKYQQNGFIRVTAKKIDEAIHFEISDNGEGIEKDRLEAIQKIMASHVQTDMDSENGFGLYNVNMRLWMQFGEGYGVTLQSVYGTGTTVKIKIPVMKVYAE